jgi:hypothetical protein
MDGYGSREPVDRRRRDLATRVSRQRPTSWQEIIRRAVLDRYERRGHLARVEASSDRMLDRWGDVLERLGRA